uniref:Uncharacterized protein n=1 Tax=Spongospora subterranea TaxID=70186 RepID=A0A0H5QLT9_9EUKA|eukprot:CRZ02572.1 hypothetical protein [Spongospora subterranea]
MKAQYKCLISPANLQSCHSVLDENERSLDHAYICSVHGSNRLGKRTARSPRPTVQFDQTVSDGTLSTTVKRSWRFASQKSASIIINRHNASIPDACSSGYFCIKL